MLDLTKPVTINGVTYEPEDIFSRRLLVNAVDPTDFEQYQHINILALHKLKSKDSGGLGQTIYKYSDLSDLKKFHEHEYPYYVDVAMTTVADKRGNMTPVVLYVDFSSVQELELVPRKNKSANLKQASSAPNNPTN